MRERFGTGVSACVTFLGCPSEGLVSKITLGRSLYLLIVGLVLIRLTLAV
jgi:hypothetical protein